MQLLSAAQLRSLPSFANLHSLHFTHDLVDAPFLHFCPLLRSLQFGTGYVLNESQCKWFSKLDKLEEFCIFDTFVPNFVMSHLLSVLPSSTNLRKFSVLFRPAYWSISEATELLEILARWLPQVELLNVKPIRVPEERHVSVPESQVTVQMCASMCHGSVTTSCYRHNRLSPL